MRKKLLMIWRRRPRLSRRGRVGVNLPPNQCLTAR